MSKNNSRLIRILLLCLGCNAAGVATLHAQPQARAYLDSAEILIGDQINLHLQLAPGTGIQPKDLDIKPFRAQPKFEIIRKGQWQQLAGEGNDSIWQLDLTITSFDSGTHWVPPMPLSYFQNGRTDTAFTDQIPLAVATVLSDTTDLLSPIKPIIAEPVRWSDYLPYLLGVLIFALMAAFAVWWRKRPKQALPAPAPAPPPPAHEIALKKLAQLEAAKWWQKGEIKRYYDELTFILREYLEGRFFVQALESTTEETLQQLKRTDLQGSTLNEIGALLQTADLVKFAKADPPLDIPAPALVRVRQFIE